MKIRYLCKLLAIADGGSLRCKTISCEEDSGGRAGAVFHTRYCRAVPYLTVQFAATGPLIDLVVGVSQPREEALRTDR